jgi:hypothetical protein
MSENNYITGRHKQRYEPSMNNPEVTKKNDWWDELCKAHGEVNHWKKEDKKAKKEEK